MLLHPSLSGVSSACTNPVLYGFLNDKFVQVNPAYRDDQSQFLIKGNQSDLPLSEQTDGIKSEMLSG